VNKLGIKLHDVDYGDDIVLAVDGSGIKVANRAEWIRQMEDKTRIPKHPNRCGSEERTAAGKILLLMARLRDEVISIRSHRSSGSSRPIS